MSFEFSTVGDPYEHQIRLFEARREEFKWAHFWEMGTGKSWQISHEVAWAWWHGEVDCLVVFAKKGEYANWGHFLLPALLPENVPREVVVFNSSEYSLGRQKQALESLMRPDPGKLRVLVVNVESLAFRAPEVLKAFYASSRKGVFAVCDESDCIKEVSAKRSKEAYVWAAKAKIKRIMTGTPVTQSPMDLWGQSMFLGKNILGFSSFYSFRNTFTTQEVQFMGQRSFKKVTGYQRLDYLNSILGSFSDQVYKSDCLDLPDKIYKKHAVIMTSKQQAIYDKMRDEAMLEIEGHEVEVTTVLALITKLHQIACGSLKVSDTEAVTIENNRIEALLELLEGHRGKAIIWANYRQNIRDIATALREKFGPDSVVEFHGGVTDPEYRKEAVSRFQDTGSPVRWFLANAQSAGRGLTLTAADLVVYYSNGYNLADRLQSEDRAHRIGQHAPVTYIDLVSPDTVDERIIEVLRNKKNLAQEVLGSPLSDWI